MRRPSARRRGRPGLLMLAWRVSLARARLRLVTTPLLDEDDDIRTGIDETR